MIKLCWLVLFWSNVANKKFGPAQPQLVFLLQISPLFSTRGGDKQVLVKRLLISESYQNDQWSHNGSFILNRHAGIGCISQFPLFYISWGGINPTKQRIWLGLSILLWVATTSLLLMRECVATLLWWRDVCRFSSVGGISWWGDITSPLIKLS